MTTANQLRETFAIADVELRYNEKGVPFDPAFDRALDIALQRAGVEDHTVQRLAHIVADILLTELRKHLKARPPRNIIGKIIRALFGT